MLRRTTFSAGLPQYVHFVCVAAASVIVLSSVDFQCRLIEAASVNLWRRNPLLASVTGLNLVVPGYLPTPGRASLSSPYNR